MDSGGAEGEKAMRIVAIETDGAEETEVLGRVMDQFFAARSQAAQVPVLALSEAPPDAEPPILAEPEVLPPAPEPASSAPQPRAAGATPAQKKPHRAAKAKAEARPAKAAPVAKPDADKLFVCPECQEKFSAQKGLNRHRNQQHDGAAKAEKKQAGAQKPFGCNECSFRGDSEQAVRIHKTRMHGTAGVARRSRQYPHLRTLQPLGDEADQGPQGAGRTQREE